MSSRRSSTQYGRKAQRINAIRRNTQLSHIDQSDDVELDGNITPHDATCNRSDSGSTEDVLLLSPSRKNYRVEVFIPSPSKSRPIVPATSKPSAKGKEKAHVTFSTPEVDSDHIPSRKRSRKGRVVARESSEEDSEQESVPTVPNKRPKHSAQPTTSSKLVEKPPTSKSKDTSASKSKLVPYVEIISPKRPILKKKVSTQSEGETVANPKASSEEISAPLDKSGSNPQPQRTPEIFSPSKNPPTSKSMPQRPPLEPFHSLDALFLSPSSASLDGNTSPSRPSGGIAKRMLARTRTEPEIIPDSESPSQSSNSLRQRSQGITTPTKQSPQKTSSMPVISPSQEASAPKLAPGLPREPSPPATSSSRPAPRTYTGKSRSFLAPQAVESTESQHPEGSSQSDSQQDFSVRESYKELRARWGVDQDIDPVDELNNVVHSVIEMRNKGENRKFLDEIGYLFEGLEPKMGLAVRRASALEVITKMADPEFRRKAKITDIIGRTWDILQQAGATRPTTSSRTKPSSASSTSASGDVVLNACLVAFMALVAQDRQDITALATRSDFTSTVVKVLDVDRTLDPFRFIDDVNPLNAEDARRAGVGKAEKRLLSALRQAIVGTPIAEQEFPLSLSQLVSYTLASLPSSAIPHQVLPLILGSLVDEADIISSRLVAHATGLSLLPTSKSLLETPNLRHISYCLRILELFLSSKSLTEDENAELDSKMSVLAKGLVEVCVFCDIAVVEGIEQSIATKSLNSGFKILITLCDSLTWAKEVSQISYTIPLIVRIALGCSAGNLSNETKPEDSSDPADPAGRKSENEDSDDTSELDQLCYTLALLMVLMQQDGERVATILGKTSLSATCERRRGCVKACHCRGAAGALSCLVSLYNQQMERSKDANNEEAHFLRGHLALLLGLLLSHESIRAQLFSSLPGISDEERVDALVETIREFVSFYAEVAKKMKRLVAAEDGESELEDSEAVERNRGESNINPSEATALTKSLANAGVAATAIDEDNRMSTEVIERLLSLRRLL
ncbi:hypothetical protein FRC02_004129 [Tulasnella sp. 418]|nr:hypothetical protein FRC02_004129 [Tulasnella sp. 418]